MPEIKSVRELGPIMGALPDRKLNVDLDSYSNAYDEGYRKGYVQEHNRATNQSGLEQLGYGLLSRTLSIVPKIGNGLGAIYGATFEGGLADVTKIWDNPMNDFFNSLDEKLLEQFPVYQSKKNAESGLLGKMATTSFWASDAFDGIAFAASAAVPGAGIGKLTQAVGKGLTLSSNVIAKATLESLKTIGMNSHRANLLLSTAYNTVAEASVEAYQTQKEIETQLLDQGLNEYDAKQKASEAAARTFRANLAVLAVPNFVQNSFFHGGWDNMQKAVREGIWKSGGKAGLELAELDKLWTSVGKGVLSEGLWEENVQTSIQQYERMAARYSKDQSNYVQDIGLNMAHNALGFLKSFMPGDESPEEIEGAVSIFLGGAIGGAMGAVGNTRERAAAKELLETEKTRYSDLFNKIAPAAEVLFRENITSLYKKKGTREITEGDQTITVNEYELDENGNPILDPEALLKLTLNQLGDKHNWDAAMLAAYRNDPALAELNKQQALAAFAYKLIANNYEYTEEEISQLLDNMGEVGDREAKELGLSSQIKENIAQVKEYTNQFRDIAQKQGSSKEDLTDPFELRFNSFINKALFYTTAKLKALNNILGQISTMEGAETVAQLIKDTKEGLEHLRGGRSKIKAIFKETIFDAEQLAVEYNNLVEQKSRTEEENNRLQELGYLLREDMAINGQWVGTGQSRTLPYGAENKTLSRVTIGSKDMLQGEVGRTAIALDRVEQDLNNPESDTIQSAVDLKNNVTAKTPQNSNRITAATNTVVSKLDEDLEHRKSIREGVIGLNEIITDLQDESNPELDNGVALIDYIAYQNGFARDAQDLEQVMEDKNIQAVVKILKDASIEVTPDTILDRNFLEMHGEALKALSLDLTKTLGTINANIDGIEKLKNDLLQETKINETSKRLAQYTAATNKEEFLKKDFYDREIKHPVEALIKQFETDEQSGLGEFDNEVEVEILSKALRSAIQAYENRKDQNNPTGYILQDAREKLQYIDTVIRPKMIANLSRRAETHKIINNDIVGEILLALGLIRSANPNIRDLFDKVLGKEKVDELINSIFANQEILSFDAVAIIVDGFKKIATKEQIAQLRNELIKYRKDSADKLLSALPEELTKIRNNLATTRGIEERIYFNIRVIVEHYFNQKDNIPPSIQKFLYDQDIYALVKMTKSDKELSEEDIKLINHLKEAYDSIVSTNIILDWLDSEVDAKDLLRIKSEMDKSALPSLQQNIVINQTLNFLNKKVSLDNYNNWLLVQGIGGSGKTFLVASSILNISDKISGHETKVYAFSKQKGTTDNLNRALFGNPVNSSMEHFLSMSIEELEKLDMIILDEIFTFTNTEIALINEKLGNVYTQTNKIIRVVALGDPSQTTAEPESVLQQGLQTTFTIPLTTSYRTNISSIVSFNRKYQLNSNQVTSNVAVANLSREEVLNNPAAANGVVGVDIATLNELLSTPSTRTRVLIVTSVVEKDNNTGRFPGVDVRLIHEAQGFQWDEVYTLLDPAELGEDVFTVNRNLYTAYSRAKNLLVIAGDPTVVNSEPNREMQAAIEQSSAELITAREMFSVNIERAHLATKIISGTPVFNTSETVPEIVESDDAPATEYGVVISPNYAEIVEDNTPPTEIVPTLEVDNKGHYFSYPVNYGLNPISVGNQRFHHMGINSIGHIIRAIVGDNEERYLVVTESLFSPGNYIVVATLSKEDFEGTAGDYFNTAIKTGSQAVDNNAINYSGLTPFHAIDKISLGKITIKNYDRFKTVTSGELYSGATGNRPLLSGAKDVIEDAIIRFYLTYYGPTANGAGVYQSDNPENWWVKTTRDANGNDTYEVNWNAIGEKAQVVIPTRGKKKGIDVAGWDPAIHNPRGLSIIYGVPYLVIWPPVVNQKKAPKPILIRLQPNKFNKTSRYYQPIRQLYEAASVIERITGMMLGTEEFSDLVHSYVQDNFIVKKESSELRQGEFHYNIGLTTSPIPISEYFDSEDTQELIALEQALQELAPMIYGAKEKVLTFTSQEQALKYLEDNGTPFNETAYKVIDGRLVVGVDTLKHNKDVWVLMESTDPQNREGDAIPFKAYRVSEGEGQAQVALNSLAQANNTLGETIQLRQTLFVATDGRLFKLHRSPSILLSSRYTDYDAFFNDPYVQDLLEDKSYNGYYHGAGAYTKLLDDLQNALSAKEGMGAAAARSKALDMVSNYSTQPFTTELLSNIVGDNAFDNRGNHAFQGSYLREPLRMHTLNNSGINDLGRHLKDPFARAELSKQLRHNFEGVTRTSIEFAIPTSAQRKPIKPPKPPKISKTWKLSELLESIPATDSQEITNVIQLLKKLPIAGTPVHYFPNGVPVGDPSSPDGVKYVTGAMAAAFDTSDQTWKIVGDADLSDVETTPQLAHALIHEALHIATAPQLHKGARDVKKGLDTKEAQLYQRLSALKKRFDNAMRGKINPATGMKYKMSDIYSKSFSRLDVFEFIANLANPEFIKHAKQVNVIPQGTRKSILRSILEAIVDYFKDILNLDNASIYDATVAVLEDYYSFASDAQVTGPIAVETSSEDIATTLNVFLSNLQKSLMGDDFILFDSNKEHIKTHYGHIINVNTLPESFGDEFTLEYSSAFKKLGDIEQASLIAAAKSNLSDLHFAYYNLQPDIVTVSPGGIATSKTIVNFINQIFSNEELTQNEVTFLRSIIIKSSLDRDFFNSLIAVSDDPVALGDLLYSRLFSQKDKMLFLEETESLTDREAATKIFLENHPIYNSINKVINILINRFDDVDLLTSSTEDRSASRYAQAKAFVIGILRANLNKDITQATEDPTSLDNLIEDRRELIPKIQKLVSSPNAILPSGNTVKDASQLLVSYYKEVSNLRSKDNLTTDEIIRVNDLLYKLIPILEDELAGVTSLRDTDSRTGTTVLSQIIKDIYPKLDLQAEEEVELALELNELAEAEYITRQQADLDISETANISEYIKEYNKSYELTLSESIKDYLSHIQVGDRTISNALAYIKTMQLVVSLDWAQSLGGDSANSILAQLRSRLRNESGLSNLDRAIINKLIDTIILANGVRYSDGITLTTSTYGTMGIVSDVSANGVITYQAYFITDPSIQNPQHLTRSEILNLSRSNSGVSLSRSTVKTIDLFDWMKSKDPDLSIRQFNRYFTKAEAINVLRGLHNTMASMKETDLYISTKSIKGGNVFRLIRSKASGISYNIKDIIKYHLFNLFEENKLSSFTSKFRARKIGGRTMQSLSSGNLADKELYIREFFSELGLRDIAASIGIKLSDIDDLIAQIGGFLDRTSLVEEFDVESEINLEESQSDKTQFHDWIENEVDGYINRFSELLAKSDDLYRNPSVRDASGNKFYKYHESSWAYDTLINLIGITKGNPVFRGGSGTDTERRVPNFLLSQDPSIPNFYDENIFVRGKIFNRIYSIGEYEAARNEDTGSVTPYTRENMFYFFQRKFIQGFLDGSRQYRDSYFQFSYIPSDKPKHPMFRIGILSDNGKHGKSPIHGAIVQALRQILQRRLASGKVDIVNYQNSLANDEFRNFQLGKRALDNLGIDLNETNLEVIADEVHKLMSQEASNLLDELLSQDIALSFDKNTYSIIRYLKDKLNPSFLLDESKLSDGSKKDSLFRNRSNGVYSVNKSDILPLFDLFFKNNYVNSYFLNQLVAGDYMAYKKDSSDIVKRYAGVFGPGIKPLVDENIGMKPTFKVMVLADTVIEKATTRDRLKNLLFDGEEPAGKELDDFENLLKFFEEKFESTDAQGFILPKRFRQLTRGYERSWGLGQVHKPMHFELKRHNVLDDNGNILYTTAIPIYLKYSAVVLDDAITDKFPTLAKLRTALEKLGVDEMVFNSAVKEGMPIVKDSQGNLRNGTGKSFTFKELLELDDDQLRQILNGYVNPPIIELSNLNYRLQHNPQASPNKRVSLFTQLMYFLNVYPDKLQNGEYANTQEAAQKAYELVAELIQLGEESFSKQISTKAGLRNFLLKKFDGPGAERALDLLLSDISINHPLLEKRSIIALASGLESATVKIKFPGGKLVLQTAEGIDLYQDPTLFSIDADTIKRGQDLRYRMEEIEVGGIKRRIMVAEVIVPKELLTADQLLAVSRGSSIYLLPDAMGFRIPSTELHSAVPLRVVGIYSNKLTNVVIAPRELVPIHGSDFDVDALFVITKELFSANETSVLGADYITTYLDHIKNLFDVIDSNRLTNTPQGIVKLKRLKEDIKKYTGLMHELDQELPETDDLDQESIETQFNQFVSTPQLYSGSNKHYVIRKTLKSYNETRARASWGTTQGLRYNTSEGRWVRINTLRGRTATILNRINLFKTENPELSDVVDQLLSGLYQLQDKDSNSILLGSADAPVGYYLSGDKYVIDDNFLTIINDNIAALESLQATLQAELKGLVGREIRNDLRALKNLKEKYLKNRIIDIMLTVISDEANKYRMLTPISFAPLTEAIDLIPSELVGGTSYDLSSLSDEYKAYSALVSGSILTGSFANASKAFGYFARSGATDEVQKYYDVISGLDKLIRQLRHGIIPDDIAEVLSQYNIQMNSVRQAIAAVDPEYTDDESRLEIQLLDAKLILPHIQKVRNAYLRMNNLVNTKLFSKVSSSPLLNRRLVFDIDGYDTFDRLSIRDANDRFTVTQVYDALTNEAIDNLKLGDLVKARINPKTGSAVIGLVSVGVPMEVIVKLMYQPILSRLSSGRVDNIDTWINSIQTLYQTELAQASNTSINIAHDLDKFLYETDTNGQFVYHRLQNLPIQELQANLDSEAFMSQIRALRLFLIGHKIGQDMRNTSTFLNILREQGVFIEDILQVDDDLKNKIGTPIESNGDYILVTRPDFSFIIPNLFESTPHVKAAYKAQRVLVEILQENLKIHSLEIQEFAARAYELGIRSLRDTNENAQSKSAQIRRSLSYYLISGIVSQKLRYEKPEIVSVGDNKIAISPLRAFSNRVANKLWKVRAFANNQNDNNLFLRNATVVRDNYAIAKIMFKSGVNLNSEDIRSIVIGFKNLNQYDFDAEGNVIKIVPPSSNYTSDLQRELLEYAVLNYGLQFSSSNYSNYIPSVMLKIIDDLYNNELDRIIEGRQSDAELGNTLRHFVLSHIMQNASSLPYISSDLIVPSRPRMGEAKAIFPGVDETILVNTESGRSEMKKVYYDLKIDFSKDSEIELREEVPTITATSDSTEQPIIKKPIRKLGPAFIRVGIGNKTRVFVRILQADNIVYYQKVGKASDAFHVPLDQSTEYSIEKYFPYEEPSLEFHYDSNGRLFTFSNLIHSLNVGDEILAYPTYNFDRTQRKRVKIKSISKSTSKEAPGYFITYEDVEQFSEPIAEEIPPKIAPKPKFKRPQFIVYNAENIFSNATKDENSGDYLAEGQALISVTQKVIPLFQTRPFNIIDTKGKRAADNLWKGEDPATLKLTDISPQPVTKDQYHELVDKAYALGIAKGTIFHKIVHQYLSQDPSIENELIQLFRDSGILPGEFNWLNEDAIKTIINQTGTNYFAKDIKLRTDRIHSEKVIASTTLGWAGTVDLFIDHGDNIYSIYDLKTGRAFNRIFESSFLKYGRTSVADIFDTPRNRAKLQVMLYAFIAKVEHPEARFRNLELLHVPDRWHIGEPDSFRHVNAKAMLEVIEGTLKNEHPTIYSKLTALPHFKQLFDPASYVSRDLNAFSDTHPNSDPAMLLKMKILEMQGLVMYDKDIIGNILKDDLKSRERYKKISELMQEIIDLRNDQSISYASWDTDMGWMDRWLGSASASTNPYVQMYYSLLTQNKQKARDKYLSWREKFDAFIRKLQEESGTKPITSLIGGTDRQKLWEFAFKNEQVGETIRRRFITEEDSEWNDNSLTNLQKEFLIFANNSVGMFFDNSLSDFIDPITGKQVALANQVITYRNRGSNEIPVTNLDLFNKNFNRTGGKREKFVYKRGFFPKHAPTIADVAAKHGGYFTPQVIRFLWNNYMTNYFEATYDGWYNTDEAIPMKYLGGSGIEQSNNYTLNVELALDAFVKQHYYKQYLDQTYAFGQAMKLYLTSKENAGQGLTYDRLIEWFEDSLNLHILGRRQSEVNFATRSFGRIKDGQYQQFNAVKFLRSLKNFFTGPTMWLKPLTGLPNFVFASLVTLKEGLKNSLGLGMANANFDLSDIAFGFKEAFKLYFWDGKTNESYRRSKAYLLMEKFGFMPDSYDWYTRPNQLLTARNRMFTSRTMMMFHSIPEEIISTAIFVAQLKSMKYTKEDGSISNVWDGYETANERLSDGIEYYGIEWKGGKRGVRNVSNVANSPVYEDITELTTEEANAVKFLYEKMHGGYRVDERVAAEYYIFGEMILQLKKYMPSILKNVWASRGVRNTQGYFVEQIDEEGNKVMKWTPQVIEGRWKILFGMLFNALAIKREKTNGEKGNKVLEWLGLQFDESYKWSELSEVQKEDMQDFVLTSLMWIAMLIGYFNLWDRDDEDTLKKIYGRIMNDFAGNVNPLEISKNVTNAIQPIAIRKGYKLAESSAELLWSTMLYGAGFDDEALTKMGNLRGWSEFERNVHFLSAWHDLNRGINESDFLQERIK